MAIVTLNTALGVAANIPDAFPENYRGQMRLTAETTLVFAAADTYQKVEGVWLDGHLNKFETDNLGTLTYIGPDTFALMNGVSDLQVNKACEVTYALFKNGVLVEGAETPHTFTATSKTSNISITRICEINTGDELEVYAKCDDGTATALIKSLTVTVWK